MSASVSGQSVSFQRKGPIVVVIKPNAERLFVKDLIERKEVQEGAEVLHVKEEAGVNNVEGMFASNRSDSSPVKDDERETPKEDQVAQQVKVSEYLVQEEQAFSVNLPPVDAYVSRATSPAAQLDDGWRLSFEQECMKYGLDYVDELGDCPLSSVTIEVVMSEDGERGLSGILDDLQTGSEHNRSLPPEDSIENYVKKRTSKIQLRKLGQSKASSRQKRLRNLTTSNRGELHGRVVVIGSSERSDSVSETINSTGIGTSSEKVHSPVHDGGISSSAIQDISMGAESSPGATVPGWHPIKAMVVTQPVVQKPTTWNGNLRIPIRSRKYSRRRSSKPSKDAETGNGSLTTPKAVAVSGRVGGEIKPAGIPEDVGDSNAIGSSATSKGKVGSQRLPAMLLPKLEPGSNADLVSGNVLAAGSAVVGGQCIAASTIQFPYSSPLQATIPVVSGGSLLVQVVKELRKLDGEFRLPVSSSGKAVREGNRVRNVTGKNFSTCESANPKVRIPRLKTAGRTESHKSVKTVRKTQKLASACVNVPIRILNPSEMVASPASVGGEIRSPGNVRLVPASLPVGAVHPSGFVLRSMDANQVSQLVLPSVVGQCGSVLDPGQTVPKETCPSYLSVVSSTSDVDAGVSSLVQSSELTRVSQMGDLKNSLCSAVLRSAVEQSETDCVQTSPCRVSAFPSTSILDSGISSWLPSSGTTQKVNQVGNMKNMVCSSAAEQSRTVIVPEQTVPNRTSRGKVSAVSLAPKIDAGISSLVQSLVGPSGLGLKPNKQKSGVLSLSSTAPSSVKVVIQPPLTMAEADTLISKGGQLKGMTDGTSNGPLVDPGPLVLYKVPANGNGGGGCVSGEQGSDVRQPVGYLIGGSALNLESLVYGSDAANARVRKRKDTLGRKWKGDEAALKGKRLRCGICNLVFFDMDTMDEHLLNHGRVWWHWCTHCWERFKHKNELQYHVHGHVGAQPPRSLLTRTCDKCGVEVLSRNFAAHKMVHREERPYDCGLCGKTFRTKEHLKSHLFCHTDARPFECHVCGKCLKRKSALAGHLLLHTNQVRQFGCGHCGRAFPTLSRLKVHEVVHFDDRNFPCPICGKYFKTQSVMRSHAKGHLGTVQHSCTTCEQKFKSRVGLRKHQKRLNHLKSCDTIPSVPKELDTCRNLVSHAVIS